MEGMQVRFDMNFYVNCNAVQYLVLMCSAIHVYIVQCNCEDLKKIANQQLIVIAMVPIYHSEDIINCKPEDPMIWQQFPGFGIRAPLHCQIYNLHKNGTILHFTTSVQIQEQDPCKKCGTNIAVHKYSTKMLIVMLMIQSDVSRYARMQGCILGRVCTS